MRHSYIAFQSNLYPSYASHAFYNNPIGKLTNPQILLHLTVVLKIRAVGYGLYLAPFTVISDHAFVR